MPLPSPFKKYIIQSLLIHVFLVTFLAVFVFFSTDNEVIKPQIIRTRLLKLGKKRLKELLPRKTSGTRRKKVKKPKVIEKKKKLSKLKPVEKAKTNKKSKDKKTEESLSKAQDLLASVVKDDALSDLISDRMRDLDVEEESQEGFENGFLGGTELNGRLKASYNDVILHKIESQMQIPMTIGDVERYRLQSQVFLSIDVSGVLIDVKIFKGSGNLTFDHAALRAVRRASPFGKPPLLYQNFYKKGFRVNICPLKCPS